MPKLISKINNPALRKMAEEEREKQNPGSTNDNIGDLDCINWGESAQGWDFWDCVYYDDPALLSHPLYPKEETVLIENQTFSNCDYGVSVEAKEAPKTVTLEQYYDAHYTRAHLIGRTMSAGCELSQRWDKVMSVIKTFEKENNLK